MSFDDRVGILFQLFSNLLPNVFDKRQMNLSLFMSLLCGKDGSSSTKHFQKRFSVIDNIVLLYFKKNPNLTKQR